MSTKIKVLNAFAGFGGNTELWDREKFQVEHVENNLDRVLYLRDNFVHDPVHYQDAYEFIIRYFGDYDVIWASPDCQTHSRGRLLQKIDNGNKGNFKYPDFRLYELIIFLQHFCNEKIWIVENVIPYYDEYINPKAVVGRYNIWSNKTIQSRDMDHKLIRYIKANREYNRNRMDPNIGLYILSQTLLQKSLEDFNFA